MLKMSILFMNVPFCLPLSVDRMHPFGLVLSFLNLGVFIAMQCLFNYDSWSLMIY